MIVLPTADGGSGARRVVKAQKDMRLHHQSPASLPCVRERLSSSREGNASDHSIQSMGFE